MEPARAYCQADAAILTRLIAPLAGSESCLIAHRLMERFGTLPTLFAAQDEVVRQVMGGRADIARKIGLLAELVRRTGDASLPPPQYFHSPEDVIKAVAQDMLSRRKETLRVLFLGGDNRLLSDEIMAEGSVSTLTFHPREIIRKALETDATALIMVHNHPNASPVPSQPDICSTQLTARLANGLDISLHDHLIISPHGWRSMRMDGYLK